MYRIRWEVHKLRLSHSYNIRINLSSFFDLCILDVLCIWLWVCVCVCLGECARSDKKNAQDFLFLFQSCSLRSKFVVLCDLLRLNKLLHPPQQSIQFDRIYWIQVDFICSMVSLSLSLIHIHCAGKKSFEFVLVLFFWKYVCQFGLWWRIIYASIFIFSKNILFIKQN